MAQLFFSIQNPQSTPPDQFYIYLGQQNTLNFRFYTEVHEVTFMQHDSITILIPKGILASPANVSFVAPGWTMAYAQDDRNDQYLLTLSDQDAIEVSPNEDLIITLTELEGETVTAGDVNLQYLIGGRKESGPPAQKIAVMDPPNQPNNLPPVISFSVTLNEEQSVVDSGKLFLSPPALNPPIANCIHLNLKYGGEQLLPSGYEGKTPQFLIYFSYGNNTDASALTDAIKSDSKDPPFNALTSAWKISAAIATDEAHLWLLYNPNTSANTPIWIIQGNEKTNPHLFANEGAGLPSLDVYFDHVISILPEGNATIYIQWTGIAHYNAGVFALNIEKHLLDGPKVSLSSPDDGETIVAGNPVPLSWQAFGAESLVLSWDDGYRTQALPYSTDPPQLYYTGSYDSIVPDSPTTSFELNAKDAYGHSSTSNSVTVNCSDFPPPSIQQFSGALQKDLAENLQIVFTWLVNNLGNDGHFLLNGERIGGAGYNGFLCTHIIPLTSRVFIGKFTLEAYQLEGPMDHQTKEIEVPNWFVPTIVSFEGKVVRDADGNPSLAFNWQLDSVVEECTCAVVGITDGNLQNVDSNGNGGLTNVALSAERPMQRSYTLEVNNPKGAIVRKTAHVQFLDVVVIAPPADLGNINDPIDLAFYPGSDDLVVAYTDNELCVALSIIDTKSLNEIQNSGSLPLYVPGFGSPVPRSLAIAPDGSQIILSGLMMYFMSYQNQQFGPLLPVITSYNQDSIQCAFVPSWLFFSHRQDIFYCPFPVELLYNNGTYIPEGVDVLPSDPQWNSPDFTRLVIRADGQRAFVVDLVQHRLCWFNTDDFSHPVASPLTGLNFISELAISANNWIYGLNCSEDNQNNVFAFDTTDGQPYTDECAASFGSFSGVNRIGVSKDNGFVVVSNPLKNELYLLAGTSSLQHPVALLQQIAIKDSLIARSSVLFAADNTRIFLAGVAGIHVLEPIFV